MRHVQDPPASQSGFNQNTPPSQQWQGAEGAELQHPAAVYREQQNRTPDPGHGHGERGADRERDRREYRNSGWGPGRPPQNGGVGVTGAG